MYNFSALKNLRTEQLMIIKYYFIRINIYDIFFLQKAQTNSLKNHKLISIFIQNEHIYQTLFYYWFSIPRNHFSFFIFLLLFSIMFYLVFNITQWLNIKLQCMEQKWHTFRDIWYLANYISFTTNKIYTTSNWITCP